MSDQSTFLYAWETVERGCFEYFQRALGTIEGVQGYTVDNLPPSMPDDAASYFLWTFKIDGGGDVIQRNDRTQLPRGAWKMDAQFQCWASTDYLSKQITGIIIDALPVLASDGIEGLAMLYHTAWPSREWVLRPVVSDDRAGDERRFVQVTLPMECAFGNTNRIN
jgi:hypothetical protein